MQYVIGAVLVFILAAAVITFVKKFFWYILAVVALALVGGIAYIVRQRKSKDTKENMIEPVLPSVTKTPVSNKPKEYSLLEDVADDSVLVYAYECDICLDDGMFNIASENNGKSINFKNEPDNPHDTKAIAIYVNGAKLGYVYQGNVQDMIHDYTNRGWPVYAHISKYDFTDNTVSYKIGFYKPLEKMASKRVTLTKTRKKIDEYSTREDNLITCSEGDVVLIEYNTMGEGYIVRDSAYQELGELPKAGVDFVEENEYKRVVGIIESLDTNEDGNIKPVVTIYLAK